MNAGVILALLVTGIALVALVCRPTVEGFEGDAKWGDYTVFHESLIAMYKEEPLPYLNYNSTLQLIALHLDEDGLILGVVPRLEDRILVHVANARVDGQYYVQEIDPEKRLVYATNAIVVDTDMVKHAFAAPFKIDIGPRGKYVVSVLSPEHMNTEHQVSKGDRVYMKHVQRMGTVHHARSSDPDDTRRFLLVRYDSDWSPRLPGYCVDHDGVPTYTNHGTRHRCESSKQGNTWHVPCMHDAECAGYDPETHKNGCSSGYCT